MPDGSPSATTIGRFFDLSLDLLCIVGTDGLFKQVNHAFTETLGWTTSELVSRSYLDLVHEADRTHAEAVLQQRAEEGSSAIEEYRMQCSDGSYRWLASRSSSGNGTGLIYAVSRDVTQSKRADIALRKDEHRYRSLFENNPDAVFSLDPEGRLLSANRVCATLFGYEPEEMLGRVLDPLVPPEQLGELYSRLKHTLEGTATTSPLTIRNKGGHDVAVSATMIPMSDSGKVVGVYCIARDLTAEREFEAQLRQDQKMEVVEHLASHVAHDFNNIFTVIQGCSEFLRTSLPAGDLRHEDVDMIRAATGRATALTRQLLAVGQKQVMQPSILDVNSCIAGLQRTITSIMGEDIVLATDLASDLAPALVDVEQLEQVIVNVTTNARDAMPNGGKLRLATSNCMIDQAHARRHPGATTGAHIRLSISDNGCGMNETTLSRIFEPFFTTKGAAGTGLGLSTTYGIVQQSSGHIVVTSAIGAGTTFDIYLPAVHDAPNELPQPSTAVPTSGRETIVLVEDDSSVRSLTLRMLVNGGYTVIEAANGADALDTIRAWGGMVDLVITDAMMPVMNGGELAESLATEYPAIKVLFMSLYTGDEIVKRGTDSRRAFIPKPFTTTNLMQKVREVLNPRGDAK